jgi:hypothetical protein
MTILIALALGLSAVLIAVLPIGKRIKYPIAHVLLTASLCCLSWGVYVLALEQEAQWKDAEFWQATEVTILNAARETNEHNDRTSHSFKVRYKYTIDGKTYESTRYTLGTYNSSQTSIDQLIAYYRDKTHQHSGLYAPQAPEESTLIRGDQSPKGIILLFSLLPGLAAAFLFYRLIRNTSDLIAGKNLDVPEA